MSLIRQLVEDFREASHVLTAERVDRYFVDLDSIEAAVSNDDQAALERVVQSPSFVMFGSRFAHLVAQAQALVLTLPDDWAEAFEIEEDRHGVPRGTIVLIVKRFEDLAAYLGGPAQ